MVDADKDSRRIKPLPAGPDDGLTAESPVTAQCSFCGQDQAEVGRLLQSDRGACICMSCLISVNAELVEGERQS